MDVRLLYFDGCPNWREADQRLHQAMRQAGVATTVERVIVSSPEDAERLSFRGSPTVLVDGVDPFADPTAPVGLSCRVYQTPDGLRGSPTVEQLVLVLT
ncbi:MAG: thioredoxin family protein [Frankiales bacterium]|nr:thioredoxin family protein [Frankiales bacterium]